MFSSPNVTLYTLANTNERITGNNLQVLGDKESTLQQAFSYIMHRVTDIENFILVFCNPKVIMKPTLCTFPEKVTYSSKTK